MGNTSNENIPDAVTSLMSIMVGMGYSVPGDSHLADDCVEIAQNSDLKSFLNGKDGWILPNPSRFNYRRKDAYVVLRAFIEAVSNGSGLYRDPFSKYHTMTPLFHMNRGFCCKSVCRHCPFLTRVVYDDKTVGLIECALQGVVLASKTPVKSRVKTSTKTAAMKS